jgi:hypothetical protein
MEGGGSQYQSIYSDAHIFLHEVDFQRKYDEPIEVSTSTFRTKIKAKKSPGHFAAARAW